MEITINRSYFDLDIVFSLKSNYTLFGYFYLFYNKMPNFISRNMHWLRKHFQKRFNVSISRFYHYFLDCAINIPLPCRCISRIGNFNALLPKRWSKNIGIYCQL